MQRTIDVSPMPHDSEHDKQLLHLVFGGELKHGETAEFVDPAKLHIVGVYPSYAEALKAWTAVARATIDDASMRYFIVHLHRLLEPDASEHADHG